MTAEICSGMILGIQGQLVTVQSDISDGLPLFHMTGYLSAEVKEAKDRVKTALKNTRIYLPPKRVTVNLAPADLKKNGTYFDLAIAISLCRAMEIIPEQRTKGILILGELSLDGQILPLKGVLPIIHEARKQGIKTCIVPQENAKEAALIHGIRVFAFRRIGDVLNFLLSDQTEDLIEKAVFEETVFEETTLSGETGCVDFSHIKAQKLAKRALEIAVTGFHNILLEGPPGAGKSMLASAIPSIMPPLTKEEQLDCLEIHSVKSLLYDSGLFRYIRPYRCVDLGISKAGLIGGGRVPVPGEITLAHHGVLFIDELPEFSKEHLAALRVPLEEHKIHITRQDYDVVFPADFLFVAAMNPCPCGYYP